MADTILFRTLCVAIVSSALTAGRGVKAEVPLVLKSLSQSVTTKNGAHSQWRVTEESLTTKGTLKTTSICHLEFKGPDKLIIRHGMDLPPTAVDFPRLFATDLQRVFLSERKPSGGTSCMVAHYDESLLADTPYMGIWFWPLAIHALSRDGSDWKQGTGKNAGIVFVSRTRLQTRSVEFAPDLDRIRRITAISHRAGYENTYTYQYNGSSQYSAWPSGGTHRRFRVRRRADTLEDAEMLDEYKVVRIDLIGMYRPLTSPPYVSNALFPAGAFVTDRIADRTYHTSGQSMESDDLVKLGDKMVANYKLTGEVMRAEPSTGYKGTILAIVAFLVISLLAFAGFVFFRNRRYKF